MILRILKCCLGFVFLPLLIFVLTQDIQIFPLLLRCLSFEKGIRTTLPPAGIESYFVKTSDGKQIEVWRAPAQGSLLEPHIAILFHGNGETVEHTTYYLRWFRELGITGYSFDFRGYGRSEGWPSEEGLTRDALATIDFALNKDGVEPEQLLLIGNSIGTGTAAEMAARYKPRALVLLSPYESLPSLVRDHGMLGLLAPFVWYELGTAQEVSKLQNTCLIVARGMRDEIIPARHGKLVFDAYRGSGYKVLLDAELAGHNDVLSVLKSKINEAIIQCIGEGSIAKDFE